MMAQSKGFSTLLTLLSASDHMVMTHDCYRRTCQFCQTFLNHLGVDVTLVPDGDYQALEAAIQSYYELTTEERLKVGISNELVRYALGIEDPEDLLADLEQALDKI